MLTTDRHGHRNTCAPARPWLDLEAAGALQGPHFAAPLDWYVWAQDERSSDGARARLAELRAGTLQPGWADYLR